MSHEITDDPGADEAEYALQAAARDHEPDDTALLLLPNIVASGLASASERKRRGKSEFKHHLEQLHTLVSALPWPRTTPTAAQLHAAAPHLQVAWDAVCDASAERTMAQLLAAYDYAQALGLDWADPVQRAIAERIGEPERIRVLLRDPEG